MPAYGATSWSLIRSVDDPLEVQHASIWESRADFERWWFSEEVEEARAAIIGMHDIPILPSWHTLLAAE
jgi:heme-degrading monooxygenase HmoA